MTTPLLLRTMSYWWCRQRRSWRSALIHGAMTPLLYLLTMGALLGRLVDGSGPVRENVGGDYLMFVAPGLLAASAMQIAAHDGLFPVTTALKWEGAYHSMAATPLTPADVFTGHFLIVLIRLAQASALFLLVSVLIGGIRTGWAVLALPAAVLTGAAFAAPLMGYAMHRGSEASFNAINRFVVVPLFLASGVFFPAEHLPLVLRGPVWLSPLWHGASLCRLLIQGTLPAMTWLHVGYLAAVLAAGVGFARRAYRRRLEA